MAESLSLEELIKELSKITQQIGAISDQKVEGEADLKEVEKLEMIEKYLQWFNKVNTKALKGLEKEQVKPTEDSLREQNTLEEIKKKLEKLENIYEEKVAKSVKKESKKSSKKKIIQRRKKFNKLGGDNRIIPS